MCVCVCSFSDKESNFFFLITGHLRPLHTDVKWINNMKIQNVWVWRQKGRKNKFTNKVLTGHLEGLDTKMS